MRTRELSRKMSDHMHNIPDPGFGEFRARPKCQDLSKIIIQTEQEGTRIQPCPLDQWMVPASAPLKAWGLTCLGGCCFSQTMH